MADSKSDVSAHSAESVASRHCGCGKKMPAIDLHEACDLCRGTLCALDQRCAICSTWSVGYMKDYLAHMKKLVQGRERKRRHRESRKLAKGSSPSVVDAPITSAVVSTATPPSVVTTVASTTPAVTAVISASTSAPVSAVPSVAALSSKSKKGKGKTRKVDIQDLVSPSDSVSNTTSKVAKLVQENLIEFQASQQRANRDFQEKLLASVNNNVSNLLNRISLAAPPPPPGFPGPLLWRSVPAEAPY